MLSSCPRQASGVEDVGDEFQLSFAEVGRDVRMREGRAQGWRVFATGQQAVAGDTQALLFDAPVEPAHRCDT